MATLGFQTKYSGGFCYAACQDLFSWYNPSTTHCRKGCDYAIGRTEDPKLRDEARQMCKVYASTLYRTEYGALDELKDLRVHAEMFPTTPENVYRACLSGERRQIA